VCAPAAQFVYLLLGLSAAACGQLPAQGTTQQDPIFGGTPDTTHDAVMALIDQVSSTNESACSGTVIALAGASGIFLTAGHCVVANDGMGHVTMPIKVASPQNVFIVPGPDWVTSVQTGLFYGVGQIVVHPQYDGSVDSPFDVALVRFLGALPTTPVIPALGPTEDKLTVGSTVTVIGFGKTETNAMNSQRREVDRTIQSITANEFLYDQMDMKGACQGDSGGPAIVNTPNGLRVAGVTSFGDPDCTKVGASVRVSPVVTSFVQNFIAGAPAKLSCQECSIAAVGPGNACVTQSAACAVTASACGRFITCLQACTTNNCATQCKQSNAQGANAYAAVVACQCSGMCAQACAGNANCQAVGATGAAGANGGAGTGGGAGNGGGAGTGGAGTTGTGVAGSSGMSFACADLTDPVPACQTCRQTSCCNQGLACAADATCSACVVEASSSACRLNVAFGKLTQCLAGCSGDPCAGGGSATGTAGTTATGAAGSTGQTGGNSGCGCDVSPVPGPSAAVLLLAAVALAAARSPAPARRRRTLGRALGRAPRG
jgi:MYXO-CTERM domain-containing protein